MAIESEALSPSLATASLRQRSGGSERKIVLWCLSVKENDIFGTLINVDYLLK